MNKKVFIKEGFSHKGERYIKNTIGTIDTESFERLKREGYVEDVGIELGIECNSEPTDLSGYVKTTEYNKLKTEVEALKPLKATVEGLSTTIQELQGQLRTLSEKVDSLQPSVVSETEGKTLTKGKKA